MSEGNKPENVGAVRGGDGATTETSKRRWTSVVGKSDEGRGGLRKILVKSSRLQQIADESNECNKEGADLCFFLFIFFN